MDNASLKGVKVGERGKLLVTGASGFVGRAACTHFIRCGFQLQGIVRNVDQLHPLNSMQYVFIEDLGKQTTWADMMGGVDCVVHLAARVHVMKEESSLALSEFRRINVDATARLARQAAAAGVRRFIFMSTVKVNGEHTKHGERFTAEDDPRPEDAYGISKYEAEQLLKQIASETGMELVIIRPPLVYGPAVKANFKLMMRWLSLGIPMPLKGVKYNRRSFVALDNLLDLIVTCIHHPAAANQTFLVSDAEDMSTAELLNRLGQAMGRPTRLFYVPLSLLKLGLKLINKFEIYQRLCCSLQLDISKTQRLLGWTPPISMEEGLRRATESFRK